MPDWLTHLGIGYILIWIISMIPKYDESLRKYYSFFIIGMVAPDMERIISIIASLIGNPVFQEIAWIFTTISHSLLGGTIISLFILGFFTRENDTKKIYFVLLIGGVGHLVLDMIMWPWQGFGINWFYPLVGPEFAFSFHLVWPGGFEPLIITGIVLLGTIVIDLIRKHFSVFNYGFSIKIKNRGN